MWAKEKKCKASQKNPPTAYCCTSPVSARSHGRFILDLLVIDTQLCAPSSTHSLDLSRSPVPVRFSTVHSLPDLQHHPCCPYASLLLPMELEASPWRSGCQADTRGGPPNAPVCSLASRSAWTPWALAKTVLEMHDCSPSSKRVVAWA